MRTFKSIDSFRAQRFYLNQLLLIFVFRFHFDNRHNGFILFCQ